eukprot:4999338-Prymnesium_polylepis.1
MPSLAMGTAWPSRWTMVVLKPSSACRSDTSSSVVRSEPTRWKRSSLRTLSRTRTSPGTMPGRCSPKRANTAPTSPSAAPATTSIVRSTVASLHRSSDGTCHSEGPSHAFA